MDFQGIDPLEGIKQWVVHGWPLYEMNQNKADSVVSEMVNVKNRDLAL